MYKRKRYVYFYYNIISNKNYYKSRSIDKFERQYVIHMKSTQKKWSMRFWCNNAIFLMKRLLSIYETVSPCLEQKNYMTYVNVIFKGIVKWNKSSCYNFLLFANAYRLKKLINLKPHSWLKYAFKNYPDLFFLLQIGHFVLAVQLPILKI